MDWPDHTHLMPFSALLSLFKVYLYKKTFGEQGVVPTMWHYDSLIFMDFFQHIYRRKYTEDITQPDADLQQAVHQSLDSEFKSALKQRKKRKDNQATSLLWGDFHMCLLWVVQVVSRIVWVCMHAWVCTCVFLCVQPMCTNHGSTCAYVISSTMTLFWYSPAAQPPNPSKPPLLTRFNLNPRMDNKPHAQECEEWNDMPIPKLPRFHWWSLGMDT